MELDVGDNLETEHDGKEYLKTPLHKIIEKRGNNAKYNYTGKVSDAGSAGGLRSNTNSTPPMENYH